MKQDEHTRRYYYNRHNIKEKLMASNSFENSIQYFWVGIEW